jgi:hypothetical protein
MRVALKILGRNESCQMPQNPPDLDSWIDALNSRFFGKGPKIAGQEWEQLFGHCEVMHLTDALDSMSHSRFQVTTGSGASLAQELVAVATRSPPRHHTKPVAKLGRNKPFVVASCLDPRFLGRLRPFFRLVWMTFFGDFPSEDITKKRFAEHCENLGEDVPKERLLEYKAGEGWERVCILLESESPEDSEYPAAVISDTQAFGEQMHKLTYGVFQGLGGTVVMQIALVGTVGISISFAHRNL